MKSYSRPNYLPHNININQKGQCDERNATAIVSQKMILKKLVVRVSLDQEKNKLVVQRKRCTYQVKNVFFNPNESLATSG